MTACPICGNPNAKRRLCRAKGHYGCRVCVRRGVCRICFKKYGWNKPWENTRRKTQAHRRA